MTNLLKLAERCEQARDADGHLDLDIWIAVGRPNEYLVRDLKLDEPDYTASIDAAMMLAEGFGGEITFFKDGTAKAFLWQPYPMAIEAKATSPARAICAAALKARAASRIDARRGETGTGSISEADESLTAASGDAQPPVHKKEDK